ncbi:hypothetical protein PV04_05763 [Phialophora macrospora]|uniref:Heterokaryon incompatibility domain-containing protein n=1 Tax=Phialophora macrospora TaxID=1851006 RepID=A0A0D2FEF8_9EURO|nr:hypothetical protein PV04_05763 [Phialophora macrospora]
MSLALGALMSLRAAGVQLQGWAQDDSATSSSQSENKTTTWHVHLPRAVEPDPELGSSEAQRAHSQPVRTDHDTAAHGRRTDLQDDRDHPDFDEQSRWPRRLLHVPTMTSYQWRPDNSYNGVKAPEYAIVSYTWGRWRLTDAHSGLEALGVKGVPWEIPKVDPRHFTATQFHQVLQVIIENSAKESNGGAGQRDVSPFVWLDVACIPQWQNSPVADSEVGRQARIFRGARTAYVWLTTPDPVQLGQAFSKRGDKSPEDIANDVDIFCTLLQDPWFGSMWTLQESFIQQAAFIVTNSGLCSLSDRKRPLDLFYVRGVITDLIEGASHPQHGEMTELLSRLKDLWFRAGLQGPLSTSPMQVLACARFRTSEFELDRVYGIMQIFGDEFQVGKARVGKPGREPADTRSFTLRELEDELGALILEKFPSTSQLFQHDAPALAGRAWRICGPASVPRQLGYASGSFNDGLSMLNKEVFFPKAQCTLAARHGASTTWATFRGRVCPFDRIVASSRSTQFAPIWTEFHVYLDAGPDLSAMGKAADLDQAAEESGSAADVSHLIWQFGSHSLAVLLLSVRESLEVGRTIDFDGLLLLRPGPEASTVHKSRRQWHLQSRPGMDLPDLQAWARVGVCQMVWYEERSSDGSFMSGVEVDTLLGASEAWVDQEGVWG